MTTYVPARNQSTGMQWCSVSPGVSESAERVEMQITETVSRFHVSDAVGGMSTHLTEELARWIQNSPVRSYSGEDEAS